MKKMMLSMLAIMMIASTSTIQAQDGGKPAMAHKVGLIDMAHVFQNYKKFEALRNEMQAEIGKSEAQGKQMMERLQKMQEEIKKYDVGSAQFSQAEKVILEEKGKFDAFRAGTQRQLARRESEMFKVIYGDVTSAVTKYAEWAKFTHVMRFNRKGIDDSTSPQEAVQTMNKTFIYWNKENDITDMVLKYLNNNYAKAGGAPSQVRTVNGP